MVTNMLTIWYFYKLNKLDLHYLILGEMLDGVASFFQSLC